MVNDVLVSGEGGGRVVGVGLGRCGPKGCGFWVVLV